MSPSPGRLFRLGLLAGTVAVGWLLINAHVGAGQDVGASRSRGGVAAAQPTSNPNASGQCTQHQPCLIGYNCCGDEAVPEGRCGQNGTGYCCPDGKCCKAGKGCGP